jgi:curved DNA-binding protein CbpA
MADYKNIDEARKVLELDDTATLYEIKDSYRRLAMKYHPDKCKEKNKKECEEMFKKINHAKNVLLDYCFNFHIPFNEESAKETKVEKEFNNHYERFYDTWWGDAEK